jgi:hypothetical protein
MAECSNCGATLDPAWKFCIHCGTAVSAIPSAIRPDAPPEQKRTGPSLFTTLSILAILLGLLIGAATVVFVLTHVG